MIDDRAAGLAVRPTPSWLRLTTPQVASVLHLTGHELVRRQRIISHRHGSIVSEHHFKRHLSP
jgi:hypothetical protein